MGEGECTDSLGVGIGAEVDREEAHIHSRRPGMEAALLARVSGDHPHETWEADGRRQAAQ